eukprot:TRINITY_DN4729_c0_g4_i3.p1 TRINITY_DN4729_c0_g4~~TRINITY_DN4729_c0_g4_i3.p1  ORF type:complete len:421 (-),score=171.98 TRINITY_DN4729_c0_g4_i3:100-1362(-)
MDRDNERNEENARESDRKLEEKSLEKEAERVVKKPSEEKEPESSKEENTAVAAEPAKENDWMIDGMDPSELKNPVIDGILGCIYGQALGDAVGLATEFSSKEVIKRMFGDGPIPFPKFDRTGHSRRWEEGDWTDDTDQMILIMEGITSTRSVDPLDFAQRLRFWVEKGFPELGDKGGMGLGATVGKVVRNQSFLKDPKGVAKWTWESFGKNLAANGAIMRTSILGCYHYQDLKEVAANTKTICKVTHYDPRCVHNCLATTRIIANVLQMRKKLDQGSNFVLEKKERDELIKNSMKEASKLMGRNLSSSMQSDMNKYVILESNTKTLLSLELDDSDAIGYTLKCFGSGLWGFTSERDFKATINELVMEGGDADTNGAVCGAMMGVRIGYSNLPKDWLSSLQHKKWLDDKVKEFLRVEGLIK